MACSVVHPARAARSVAPSGDPLFRNNQHIFRLCEEHSRVRSYELLNLFAEVGRNAAIGDYILDDVVAAIPQTPPEIFQSLQLVLIIVGAIINNDMKAAIAEDAVHLIAVRTVRENS